MTKKCDKNQHNWRKWELRWDAKEGKIWMRWCLDCPTVEKSKYTPPPEPTVEDAIKWFDLQMSKK